MGNIINKSSIKSQLLKEYPIINDKDTYMKARLFLCQNDKGKFRELLKELEDTGFVQSNQIVSQSSNYFAAVASGKIQNNIDQNCIKNYANDFIILHNRPENDTNWNNPKFKAGSMAGPDENGPGHVFITFKDLTWNNFNVLVFGFQGLVEYHTSLLEKMKECAQTYANHRQWNNVGLYFHAFPHNSVHSLHLHVVNLDNVGIHFENQKFKNLELDVVLDVLKNKRFTIYK